MLRYIKVNNTWIDTLVEQRDNHDTYIVIDGEVFVIDNDGNERKVGRFQDESMSL